MLYLAFIGRDRNATTHCLTFTFFFARLSWICFHFHSAYATFFLPHVLNSSLCRSLPKPQLESQALQLLLGWHWSHFFLSYVEILTKWKTSSIYSNINDNARDNSIGNDIRIKEIISTFYDRENSFIFSLEMIIC